MTCIEHWDTRTLDTKIDSMLYERTALSRKPEDVIKMELVQIKSTNLLTPDVVFRSSYFLDAIGLVDVYWEKELESAILINLQSFIKELGSDFASLYHQKKNYCRCNRLLYRFAFLPQTFAPIGCYRPKVR